MGPKKDPKKSKSLGKMVFITSLGSRPLRSGRSDFIFCWKNEGLRAQGSALGKHHKEFILVEVFEVTL